MREKKETNLDFIGYDPYTHDIKEIYEFGHGDYAIGCNLPMIMENGGDIRETPQLILAALAGGSFYNIYNLLSPDTNSLYVNTDLHTYVPRGKYVLEIRKLNSLLNRLGFHLATKLADGAGGSKLLFFNELSADCYTMTKSLGFWKITFETKKKGVGVATIKENGCLILASTAPGRFVIEERTVKYHIEVKKYEYIEFLPVHDSVHK